MKGEKANMRGERFKTNTRGGRVLLAPCDNCSGAEPVKHSVVVSVDVKARQRVHFNDGSDDHLIFPSTFQIIKCAGCDWLTFRHEWEHVTEAVTDGEGKVRTPTTVTLYPPRQGAFQMARHHERLPGKVRELYVEVHSALRNQQPVLAGMGIRILIEMASKKAGITRGDLKDKIDELVTRAHVPRATAGILHRCRWLGNSVAHEGLAPTHKQLAAAMMVVDHLLASLWLLEKAAASLPKGP